MDSYIRGLISIIVPTYNLENYITNCLKSLTNQTYRNIDIIVVDDGSKDGTCEIVRKLQSEDNRIHLVSQQNGGAARARNRGLDMSHGEYIVFVDGDDMLDSDTLESNVDILEKDSSIDWVAFSIVRTDESGNPISIPGIYSDKVFEKSGIICAEDFVPSFYKGILSGVCCGAIYRKSAIHDIRFPEGEYYEDGFFFIDLLSKTSKGYLSNLGRYQYVHRDGSSQLIALDKAHLMSDVSCSTKRLMQYRKRFPEYESIYKEWENKLYYYYKNEVAKKTDGAEEVFSIFKSRMMHKRVFNFKQEIKFMIYRTIGYDKIKKFMDFL